MNEVEATVLVETDPAWAFTLFTDEVDRWWRRGERYGGPEVTGHRFEGHVGGRFLELSEEARRYIAQQGFDPVYGARPLRRFISREVETRIGRALLAGDVRDGAVIRVGLAGGELTVTYENPAS